ncbi:MAG: YdcF family protein [Actinobacteria bacterium]|nr:YdcF family protein [Actinomycetota bacterium]
MFDYLLRQLVDPAFLFFLGFLFLLYLSWRGSERLRRKYLSFFLVALLVVSNSWIAALAAQPLESYGLKNSPLGDAQKRTSIQCKDFSGVIALGGVISSVDYRSERGVALLAGAERVVEPVVLYRSCPNFTLVYSSFGPESGGAIGEAELAKRTWISLGVKSSSIIIENTSNNTYQNAIQTKKLLGDDGTWLLVTSAIHMKRATMSFKKAGLDVTAIPVDYIWSKTPPPWTFSFFAALNSWRAASHEYIGYLYYRMRDWI